MVWVEPALNSVWVRIGFMCPLPSSNMSCLIVSIFWQDVWFNLLGYRLGEILLARWIGQVVKVPREVGFGELLADDAVVVGS